METTTVVNQRHQPKDNREIVYIGRGPGACHMASTPIWESGWLGNPYALSMGESREDCIEKFRIAFMARIETDSDFRRAVLGLRGMALSCWCAPESCHGDVIAEWIDSQTGNARYANDDL